MVCNCMENKFDCTWVYLIAHAIFLNADYHWLPRWNFNILGNLFKKTNKTKLPVWPHWLQQVSYRINSFKKESTSKERNWHICKDQNFFDIYVCAYAALYLTVGCWPTYTTLPSLIAGFGQKNSAAGEILLALCKRNYNFCKVI